MQPIIKKIISGVLLGWLFLFSFQRIFFQSGDFIDACFSYVAYPCIVVSHAFSERVSTISHCNISYKELQEQYQKLQEEHANAIAELTQLKACTYYFHAIQELVEFRSRYEQQTAVIAHVISKTITEHEHSMLVDRGAQDGICPDMIAMFKTHIVGRVTEVFGWYCKIVLITDRHSKIAIYTCKTEAAGIVQGTNDIKRLSCWYVNHLAMIEDSDMVLSSGQGLVFPQGFCVGKIVRHELPDKALYHTIDVEPFIDLSVLNCCALIKVENINQS